MEPKLETDGQEEKKEQPKPTPEAGEQKPKGKPPKKEAPKAGEEEKPLPKQPEQPDPYLAFIRTSQIVSPSDVAVYRQGDGYLVLFTDPLGRSALSCSLFLRKEIMESLKKAMA